MNMQYGMQIGIDLGGTKTEGIALRDGQELLRERVETARDYSGCVERIASLVEQLEQQTGEYGSVGLGIPGAMSPETGKVKNANSTWLIGEDLQGDLERRLGRPVRIANDADCFVVSEASDGAAADAETVFGVIIGTGCGGGFCIHGRLLQGPNVIAGEWGHNPLPYRNQGDGPSRPCYCGRSDCLETFVSGPGLTRTYAQLTGEERTAQWIAAHPEQPAVHQALQRYYSQLSRGLAGVINIVDPHCIVLGGGVSNIPHLYTAEFAEEVARNVFSETCRTRIVKARFGDSSGVRGAARLWPDSSANPAENGK
ncbi:ROK family protein [Marinobacteraceae bacterium S3BR75-40.1]